MRLLLIEDDPSLADGLQLMLRAEGFGVTSTEQGDEGVSLAKQHTFDLILLDLGLPDISGLEVLRRMRERGVVTPVIILTGDARIEQKVRCLSAGADDYVTRPFHRDELVGRIRAVVRRSRGHAGSTIVIGDLTFHLGGEGGFVVAAGAPVRLTKKEQRVLEVLALSGSDVVTKYKVMDELYGGEPDEEPDPKIIDVYVHRIRRKLKDAGARTEIDTIWGRGFALRVPPAEAAE